METKPKTVDLPPQKIYTRDDYFLDALKGEECSWSKLTNKQVIYIRNNPDGLNTYKLAEKFGMSVPQISYIQTGKKWQHVGGTVRDKQKGGKPRVSDEIRSKIRADAATGNFTQKQLAEMYNVCQSTISRIINGRK